MNYKIVAQINGRLGSNYQLNFEVTVYYLANLHDSRGEEDSAVKVITKCTFLSLAQFLSLSHSTGTSIIPDINEILISTMRPDGERSTTTQYDHECSIKTKLHPNTCELMILKISLK